MPCGDGTPLSNASITGVELVDTGIVSTGAAVLFSSAYNEPGSNASITGVELVDTGILSTSAAVLFSSAYNEPGEYQCARCFSLTPALISTRAVIVAQ